MRFLRIWKHKALIAESYAVLCREYGPDTDVAVRSSATAEDLPDASFAGQHETFLNVHGLSAVLEGCKKSFASMFTDRAINYRHEHGFDHMKIALSVGVPVRRTGPYGRGTPVR